MDDVHDDRFRVHTRNREPVLILVVMDDVHDDIHV